MKTLALTKGYTAQIDNEDYIRCQLWNWVATENGSKIYALAIISGKRVYLHHFILSCNNRIDHRDGNGLNCQKTNLRFASIMENNRNSMTLPGWKGVYRKGNRWYARIWYDNRWHSLGGYNTREEAAQKYDRTAKEIFGAFACLNFPEGP